MATNKNITMKQYNGTDYDTLYPKTTAEQVIGAVTTVTYIATTSTSWTSDTTNGGYYQTIAVSGIKSTDNPIADIVLGSNVTSNKAALEAWALVTRITTDNDSVTVWANGDAPTTTFSFQLKVVR